WNTVGVLATEHLIQRSMTVDFRLLAETFGTKAFGYRSLRPVSAAGALETGQHAESAKQHHKSARLWNGCHRQDPCVAMEIEFPAIAEEFPDGSPIARRENPGKRPGGDDRSIRIIAVKGV